MKTSSRRSLRRQYENAAFTLIELLAVMAIILVLAGLIINIAGNANYNSAKARATTEIKAMETALEGYKSDNGAYPTESTSKNGGPSNSTTEMLDPHDVTAYKDPGTYVYASEFLFQALTGQQPNSNTVTKSYINFTPQQLKAAKNAPANTAVSQNSPYMYIIDPFGFSYGYSTAYAADLVKTPGQTPTRGYNPTFDLWSTAGYAGGGKATPSNMQGADDAAKYSTLWVKNW